MNFEVFSQESTHEHIQRHVYTNENYEPNNPPVLCVGKTSDENNPLSLRLNIYF